VHRELLRAKAERMRHGPALSTYFFTNSAIVLSVETSSRTTS
jgi:hypothetical protein